MTVCLYGLLLSEFISTHRRKSLLILGCDHRLVSTTHAVFVAQGSVRAVFLQNVPLNTSYLVRTPLIDFYCAFCIGSVTSNMPWPMQWDSVVMTVAYVAVVQVRTTKECSDEPLSDNRGYIDDPSSMYIDKALSNHRGQWICVDRMYRDSMNRWMRLHEGDGHGWTGCV